MVSDGTTTCSARVRSPKEKKNWREIAEYLRSRVDKTRILRREGLVIICDLEALKQEEGKSDAGQWQRHKFAVGYCSCGAPYPPRVLRGGNRSARRQRQKEQTEGASGIIRLSRGYWRSR